MPNSKKFWISISLINLCIVAVSGFVLRSKILFPIPLIDFKNFLSAHSHFALSGWAGLALSTLLIYELLPLEASKKRIYQYILGGTVITSYGMIISFPFKGYAFWSIVFSTAYILCNYFFAFVFTRDVLRFVKEKSLRCLGLGAIFSLAISSIGPFGLAFELTSHSKHLISASDYVYSFLHLQYNGFFTLSIIALFLNDIIRKKKKIPAEAYRMSTFICLSVIPSLFLSLLWHGNAVVYTIAAAGACFTLIGTYYLYKIFYDVARQRLMATRPGQILFTLSFFSLLLKFLLQAGTIFPAVGNAVYGDRPLIIGFLHLVLLAFMTLFLLSRYVEEKYFTYNHRILAAPLYLFVSGVLLNEIFLMLQGLGILLKINSEVYNWLLWLTSIVLVTGTVMISSLQLRIAYFRKKFVASPELSGKVTKISYQLDAYHR